MHKDSEMEAFKADLLEAARDMKAGRAAREQRVILATAKVAQMTTPKQPASRTHDAAVVELLRADPGFADEYIAAALAEADEPGGQAALLAALRHVAEAQGMATVAERAGIPRESL